jgi:aspartate-semialdehyde dehydrogenase
MHVPRIAVIGATGNVGRSVVEMLLTRKLATPPQILLYASLRSSGQVLSCAGAEFSIEETTGSSFTNQDLCIFTTESPVSQAWIPFALKNGAYVVDSSSQYRLMPNVPLIVPPVNIQLVTQHQKLYAHANCLASPIATVSAPLHRKFGLVHIEAVTYQSTAGAGKAAMDECIKETRAVLDQTPYTRSVFSRQIAFNVIPQVGDIRSDGLTFEEYKIIEEVKKVVDPHLSIMATAVRVPVLIGHSISLQVKFAQDVSVADVLETLRNAPAVQLSPDVYSTPTEVVGSDDVWVGRVRQDPSQPRSMYLWLCSDNLRRGAATDAVEIAEAILSL